MIWLALAGMWLVGVTTGWHLHAIRKLRRRGSQPIDLTGHTFQREWTISRSKGDA